MFCRNHVLETTSERREDDHREGGFANVPCSPLLFCFANHIKGCKVYKTQFSIFTAHFCSIKCGHIAIRHPSLQHSQPPKLKLGHHSALNTHTSFPLVPDNNRDFRSYLYKCGYFDVSYKWNHTVFVLSSFYTFLECYPIFFLFPSKEVKFSSVVNYSPDTVKKLFFFSAEFIYFVVMMLMSQ